MESITVSAKNVDEAVTQALIQLGITSDQLEYEVVDKGSSGILGIGSRPAVIKAKKKFSLEGTAHDFLSDIFRTMNMEVEIDITFNEEEKTMDIDLKGDDMGILIGKRGQTLDSLQYLVSLVANRGEGDYIRVNIDSGNYREKREKTLIALAKKLANTAVRTGKSTTDRKSVV